MRAVPFYEEKQTNPAWIGWIIILSGVGLLTFLTFMFIERYDAAGGAWSKDLTSLLGAAAGSSIALAVAAWLVFINHLTVTITEAGVQYLFVPTFWKPRTVSADAIVSFEVRKLSLWEFLQASRRYKSPLFTSGKKEVCILRTFTVADLALADGRHLLLGTRNPDGIRWALKKLKSAP